MKKLRWWVRMVGMAVWGAVTLAAQNGAEVWKLPEPAHVVGAALQGGTIFIATPDAVLRRGGERFSVFWKADTPGTISHGPLIEGERMYVVGRGHLLVSPLGQALSFKPVTVGGKVWDLPRRVHDRWVIQTDAGVWQSRDLQKWEALFPADGIYAKHLAWMDGMWWALQHPPAEAPDASAKIKDGEAEEETWTPGLRGGTLGASRTTMQLRRSPDLKQWTTVREVDVSLIDAGLFSFAGKLVAVGEAGLDILPADTTGEIVTADASEGLKRAAVLGSRMWLTTAGGVLFSGENDPETWTWMDGEEFAREISGEVTALPTLGRIVAFGTSSGQLALLRPADQERVAAGGLAFAVPAIPEGLLATGALPPMAKQVVAAGGRMLAITGEKNGLFVAERGKAWKQMAAFGKEVGSIAVVGNRALGVVDYSGVFLWDIEKNRELPVDALPVKSVGRAIAANGKLFAIGSAGGLFQLGEDGKWTSIELPAGLAAKNGVSHIMHHAGYYIISAAGEPGLFRTTDFKEWLHAPMRGGSTGAGRVIWTGRRLIAVQTYGTLNEQPEPVHVAVSADGVTWQQIEGLTVAKGTYYLTALFDGTRHVLVFTNELWVSEGEEALQWRRVPVAANRFFKVNDTELAEAGGEALTVFDTSTLDANVPMVVSSVRTVASPAVWRAFGAGAADSLASQSAAAAQVAKREADAEPPTVAGAAEMAKTFLHFENLYVSGASRRELAQQVVGVYEAVKKHRPSLAAEVAETLAITVVNLEPNDVRTTAFLAHHVPEFRRRVQALYGKSYSQVYWGIQKARGGGPAQEFEVDILKELLMSHTDNSYLRRVTFPKIPQNFPTYEPDKARATIGRQGEDKAPFDAEMIRAHLLKGWAGAALDRDIQHVSALDIQAAPKLRYLWLVAARTLWPGTPPRDNRELFARSLKEKARMGSLFAADALALDAKKAGDQDEFTQYRDLAIRRGMLAARYQDYTQMLAESIKAMNEATANIGAAMRQYNEEMSEVVGAVEKALEASETIPRPGAGAVAASANPVGDLLREANERAIARVREGDEAFARASFSTAKNYWEDAESAGNHEAALRLALLYTDGLGVPTDLQRALVLAEKATLSPQTKKRAEVLLAKLRVLMKADVSATDAEQARADAFKAVGLVRPTQNPEADFQSGRDYEDGRKGTSPSERRASAITAYRRASDSDHVLATMALVRLLNEQRLELADKPDSGDGQAVRRYEAIVTEISERILRASRLGNGEALRIHALWIGQGQMGGDAQSNAVLALTKLEGAAEAGDLIAMRLLIRAAQAGEWKPPAADTLEQFVEKLAAAGEADAKALVQKRDEQKSFEREFWGERGAPVADPKAATAAVPVEATPVNGVPRPLFNHFQLSRPSTTTARSVEAARALVIAMMNDGRIDAVERTILLEVTKPSFRLKLMQPSDGQGAARELVFLGSYQPQARAFIERFIPPAGSDQPDITPLMRRYFWVWTGVHGWKQAIAHAESSPVGRQEMLTVIQNWLGEKWSGSNTANNWGPIRDELGTFKTVLAQMKGREHEVGRALVYEASQALDKSVKDALPDFLYAEFKDAPEGK